MSNAACHPRCGDGPGNLSLSLGNTTCPRWAVPLLERSSRSTFLGCLPPCLSRDGVPQCYGLGECASDSGTASHAPRGLCLRTGEGFPSPLSCWRSIGVAERHMDRGVGSGRTPGLHRLCLWPTFRLHFLTSAPSSSPAGFRLLRECATIPPAPGPLHMLLLPPRMLFHPLFPLHLGGSWKNHQNIA